MISIGSDPKTADVTLDKVAIEIPDDYLQGPKEAAAAVEDMICPLLSCRRCWKTMRPLAKTGAPCVAIPGTPRWYVKWATIRVWKAAPSRLEAALRRHSHATNGVPLRPEPRIPLAGRDHDNNVGIGAPGDRTEYG
jgi:L(+)-tartrate dehydratase alpha subunit